MHPHYHINVFWYPADECWVADVPDLQACSAFGDSPDEALAEVQIAMSGWIAAALSVGLEIPEARYIPEPFKVSRAA